jgi:hypothetical protein
MGVQYCVAGIKAKTDRTLEVVMKSTSVKAMVAKMMTVGLLAGAVAMVAPAKAQAQQFVVSAQFGAPAPVRFDARRDYYEHLRIEEARRAEFERREAIRRHEEWVRMHRFHEGFGWR